MRKKNEIKPITSPALIKIIGQELRAMHEDYYFIFSIILETGYPLGKLLDCRVKDLKDKSAFTFSTSKRYKNEREAPISQELKNELAEFFKDKSDNNYAFVSRYTGEQLHFGTFKQTLQSISNLLGLDPPVTVLALERTYKYNLYIKKPDIQHGNGSRKSHETMTGYFGAESLEDRYKIVSSALKVSRERVTETFKKISDLCKHPTDDNDTYSATLKLLASIDSAIDRYSNSLNK